MKELIITPENPEGVLVDISANKATEITAKETEFANILAEREANAYKDSRKNEYPNIGDQLDALFHAGVFPEDMAAQIQAVKDAHPKP